MKNNVFNIYHSFWRFIYMTMKKNLIKGMSELGELLQHVGNL